MTMKERKLMRIIKEQQRVIDTLSDKRIIKGLNSALKDFKKGNYTILTK